MSIVFQRVHGGGNKINFRAGERMETVWILVGRWPTIMW